MELLAAIAALAPLAVALLEAWAKRQPARRRAAQEDEYDGDVLELERALKQGKAGALTTLFELERRAARKRGGQGYGGMGIQAPATPLPPDPAGPAHGLQRAGADGDPGRSDDQSGGLRGA